MVSPTVLTHPPSDGAQISAGSASAARTLANTAPLLEVGLPPSKAQCACLRPNRYLSSADVTRVQAPRDSDVGGPFDDCAAIRKYGQQVGRHFKPQREIVGANGAQGRQPRR